MTSLSVLNQFFNERINAVDGQTRPVLQRLKSICERRASGQISEQKALFELDKILGRRSGPAIPSFVFGSSKSKPMNLFAGVKTNYKESPLQGVMDFGLKNKRGQFPVLGLRPLNNSPKNKRFVVAPMSRAWFDVKDFRKSAPVMINFKNVKSNGGSVLNGLNLDKQNKSIASQFKSDVFTHRVNESNRAMKAMLNNARKNMGTQPTLGNAGYSKKQSVFEMMRGKK
jgi:hypothetical protein